MERQRVEALNWEAELKAVPPGAVRYAAGMEPPPGFKMALVLSAKVPEENGVYFVPAIELLPPKERERVRRRDERMAGRGAKMIAPGVWACAVCGTTDANLRFRGAENIGCDKCLGARPVPCASPAAAPDETASAVEEQVNQRIEELFQQPPSEEGARLWALRRIYHVISGAEWEWVDLPADVAAELFGKPQSQPWVIKYEAGRDPGCGRVELSDRERLWGGWTARLADVRAAADAAAHRLLAPAPVATMEEQVSYRLGQLLHGAEFMPRTAERASLSQLSRIYRVISGEERGPVDLPDEVRTALGLCDGGHLRWTICEVIHPRDGSGSRAALHLVGSLGSGFCKELSEVRAAVDAAARRILLRRPEEPDLGPGESATQDRQPSRCRACGGRGQIFYLDAGAVRCPWCEGGGAAEPIKWPPLGPDGWTLRGEPYTQSAARPALPCRCGLAWPCPVHPEVGIDGTKSAPSLGSGIDWPSPALLDACDRTRLFLSSLDYLSVADARQASELRHRLRTPGIEVLRAAVLFLGGVHPAQRGQAELVADLLHLVAMPERSPALARAVQEQRPSPYRRVAPLTAQQVEEALRGASTPLHTRT